ncbi:MAG: hypothetical protein N4A71_02290 [Carboxylicivirga sp.]|jgi:hypothetical protein|nr:hypothetical protein [Carboxylicivirga sp.]
MRRYLFVALMTISSLIGLKAQHGGMQSPEEVAKQQSAGLKLELSLSEEQEKKVYDVVLKSMKSLQLIKIEAQNNPQGAQDKAIKVQEGAITKFKQIFTEEQFKKYEEIVKAQLAARGTARR